MNDSPDTPTAPDAIDTGTANSGLVGTEEKPELFSKEFFARFSELNDHVSFNLFRDLGLLVLDDGTFKYKRPIFKAVLEEAFEAYHNEIISLEKLHDFCNRLKDGSLTRYAMEVELAKIKREAKG